MKTSKKNFLVGILVLTLAANSHALSFQSVATMFTEAQRQLSALAITVKQTALSLHQRSDGIRKSRQIASVSNQTVDSVNRIKKVVVDYSPDLGQPVTAKCRVITEKTVVAQTLGTSKDIQKSMMDSFSNTDSASLHDAKQTRLSAHNETFCNPEEAKAGACKFTQNGLSGWDSNYGNFTANNTLAPEQVVGALAYVNNMSEPPSPDYVNCKGVSCIEARSAYLSSAAQSSAVTQTLVSQVSNRMNKQTRQAFEDEL